MALYKKYEVVIDPNFLNNADEVINNHATKLVMVIDVKSLGLGCAMPANHLFVLFLSTMMMVIRLSHLNLVAYTKYTMYFN